MKNHDPNAGFWHARWLRITAGFLVGSVVFTVIVFTLWMASYFLRFILPFDQLFQSQAILKIPEVLIPIVFYDVLALPPVLILAFVISCFFGRYLRNEKGLRFSLCLLAGLATVPVSFMLVSVIGMVLSGSAADASAFALLAPLPPSFILGYLPGWKLGRSLYTQLSMRLRKP